MTFLVEQLSGALADLSLHFADMQQSEEVHHDNCIYCETAILMARVVAFGRSERDFQLQEVPRG